MTDFANYTYNDLDWNLLWQNARDKRGWSSKGPSDWDKKSASFASRNSDSPFTSLLLQHLPLTPETTVLDIGCGPGTLAIPLARKVCSVTAIDFSPGMLDILQQNARKEQLKNIRTIQCAWEDNWQQKNINVHDITIASRSLNVKDISGAIDKLNSYAAKYVFIVDRISPTPFDPDLYEAVGRSFQSGPDYIYTLNTLYTKNIHPNVVIIELEKELHFESLDQAFLSYSWMLKDMNDEEELLVRRYLNQKSQPNADGSITIIRETPPRWAVIWWKKNQH
ncbi:MULTISPECIES: class I SAM-dependent methyltransferase [Desulfosediminicola]|uniref:class I SAM-dependent methyltransferase n=1 Tax=Desulfosediminicola TaxID=2886823 RepID=UPI0010AD588D|nr:class I SAM-dependent methyltransferase [Desulfosediminicola ganghwensis]